jgi:2-polyprenyl-3-methyl-5-hydroxy-6-metoxy-1,4-benzoquinol methylase
MQEAENFREYIIAFEKKLELVVPEDITAALYIKKYLTHLLQHKKYYLLIYAGVLHKLMLHSPKNKAAVKLLDFGAGNGLLGIFAKFCGFKEVFLIDLDGKFVRASQKLAMQLNISMDGYITGDIGSALAYFTDVAPDAIIGTDVIEHIYDLDIFFKSIQQMNHSMVSVFTTASNPRNYFKVSMLKKMQLKDELEGGSPDDHIFFGESPLKPFLRIRAEIIRKNGENLTEAKILTLAKATRGMNQPDILAAVAQYRIYGKLPVPPPGHNTCDPLTGGWTERIISLKAYALLYHSAGFTPVFYNGFYNENEGGFKRYAKKILNAAIAIFGNRIAPYILIAGFRK